MNFRIERLEPRLQMAGASGGFVPPLMPVTTTNTTQVVKVMVVNFDPLVPSQGNKHLWEIFRNWTDPRIIATQYKSEMEYASGGAVKYEITEWRDVNDIPVLSNGYHYTPDEYYRNTLTNSGWQPESVMADFNAMATAQDFATPVNAGLVDEVWLCGEHYFQLFGETWMAGPDAFYVNGPVFDYPGLERAFVGTGFDYGRSVAEAMHCTAHRLESTMQRVFGGWNVSASSTTTPPPADLPGSSNVGRLCSYQFTGEHEANAEEATAMLVWLGGTVTASDPGGGWVTAALTPDLMVTIWPKTYGKANSYGIRFGTPEEGALESSYFEVSRGLTAWDRFASVVPAGKNGIGGVGNCHVPVNGLKGYDYGNSRLVWSTASDWLNYPALTGTASLVSRDTWTAPNPSLAYPDYHKDYLAWMYGHLPRASGTTPDGRQANWWKYLYNYSAYEKDTGLVLPMMAESRFRSATRNGDTTYTFTVSFRSAYNVSLRSLGTGDVLVSGPNGFEGAASLVELSCSADSAYVVTTYQIDAPGGVWDWTDNGVYSVTLRQDAVTDVANRTVGGQDLGNFSSRLVSIPSAPTSVTGTAGNGQVTLSWLAPASNGGAAITDYVIRYSSNNGATWTRYADAVSASTTTSVTGLTNGTPYIFKVSAVNVAGTGAPSSNSGPLVPRTVPGSPTSVTGTPDNGQVKLSWLAPASNGGSVITDYVIRYSSNNGLLWTRYLDAVSASTSSTITGLTNGVGYIFKVSAVNVAGAGIPSSPSSRLTPRPGPVLDPIR